MVLRYTWSARKNETNIRKHGISFVDAVRIFETAIVETIDDREDYGETRIQAIGLLEGKEIYLVYVDEDEETRRVISARKAERHERQAYWETLARTQR
ncbi:MAG: BrnT family toxin [Micropepsaceae bacterium]